MFRYTLSFARTVGQMQRRSPVSMQGGMVHSPMKLTRLGCRMRAITIASCKGALSVSCEHNEQLGGNFAMHVSPHLQARSL